MKEGMFNMYGIIDIGSNSMHLNIYKKEAGKTNIIFNKEISAGLASYVLHGRMTPEGIDKACKVLHEFQILLQQFNIEAYAFATAALRDADNSQEAIEEITRRTGIQVYVLSSEREAELDFIGASRSMPEHTDSLFVDIGGASTELVVAKDGKMVKSFTIRAGSLNMYNKHVSDLIPNRKERKAIEKEIQEALLANPEFAEGEYPNICGIGGTVRAAGKLNNDIFGLPADSMEINASNIKKLIKMLENDEEEDLVSSDTLDILVRLVPDRVRTILPGMIILHTLIRHYHTKTIQISTTGVREGYLYSHVLGEEAEK